MRKVARHILCLTIVCAIGLPRLSGAKTVWAAALDVRYVTIPFAQASSSSPPQLSAMEVIPATAGRYPLVVISHGSPRKEADRLLMGPGQYLKVATWLAEQGFAVVVPMRRGYGQSGGQWSEGYGSCLSPRYDRAGLETARDIQAVVTHMRDQSFVDPQRVVLLGISAGAWGSLAAISQNPPGVVAAIAFAPGRGSFAPDEVCDGSALVSAAHTFGSTAHVPLLWVAAENDHFFGPTLARAMFDAFQSGSQTSGTFIAAPACGQDGHMLFSRCPDKWHDTVAAFLRRTVFR